MKCYRTLVLLLAVCTAGSAYASNAYTQGNVHLRAGPSSEYPLVATVPPSTLLQVSGCLEDFTWCDVDWEGNRGWVYGNYLYFDYQDRRVPVLQVGAALGIGVVAFSIGDYWSRYYAGRPWYRRESYWEHRPIPPPRRPPFGPGGRPGHGGPGAGPRPPPGRPTPGRPTPGRPTPGQPAPGRPSPGKPSPGRPSPGVPAPGRPSPGRPPPGKPAPSRPSPGNPGTGRPSPGRPGQPDQGQDSRPR